MCDANSRTTTIKAVAIEQARQLRASGVECRVLRHSGTYTQPGRGIASYTYYTVEVAVEAAA